MAPCFNKALAVIFAALTLHMPIGKDTITIDTNAIDTNKSTTVEEFKKRGDVNGDGSVDSVDASLILSIYAETSIGKNPVIPPGAYVSPDSVVDATDASIVLAIYADISTGGYPTYVDEKGNFFAIISAGQTLWEISQKEEYSLAKLLDMNPHIEDADNISIGTVVYTFLKCTEPTIPITTNPTSTTPKVTTSTSEKTKATSTTTATKLPNILEADCRFLAGGIYKLNSTSWKLYTDNTLTKVGAYMAQNETLLIIEECTLDPDKPYKYGYKCRYNEKKFVIPVENAQNHSKYFEFVAFDSNLTVTSTTQIPTPITTTVTTPIATTPSVSVTSDRLKIGGIYTLKEGLSSWRLFPDITFLDYEGKDYLKPNEEIIVYNYCYMPTSTYYGYIGVYKGELLYFRAKPENWDSFKLIDTVSPYLLNSTYYILKNKSFPLFDETGEQVKTVKPGEPIKILEYDAHNDSNNLTDTDPYLCEYNGETYTIYLLKEDIKYFELFHR